MVAYHWTTHLRMFKMGNFMCILPQNINHQKMIVYTLCKSVTYYTLFVEIKSVYKYTDIVSHFL